MRKDFSDNVLIDSLHNYWIDRKSRQLWIHGTQIAPTSVDDVGGEPGVEYVMATRVIKNLHILRMDSVTEPVLIHMHTCGGQWEEGMAIYDSIRSMPYHVTIISYTHARSMSSIILQSADRRIMMPNSYFLIHRGSMSLCTDEALKAQSIMDWYKEKGDDMLNIYVDSMLNSPKFSGKTRDELYQIVKTKMDKKSDVYFTPTKAIEWGFADEVFTDWNSVLKDF